MDLDATLDQLARDPAADVDPFELGLHLAEGRDGWKIVAVLFSYDAE